MNHLWTDHSTTLYAQKIEVFADTDLYGVFSKGEFFCHISRNWERFILTVLHWVQKTWVRSALQMANGTHIT